ncbi:MAG TPA: UDP-N-acetylmuramoyl-L-alanyl-D-glutamate--2,6-diaminopimelate ligase [Planctomycetota bacterium]|nr:UDP-N-acetylmuramoyl-L-alanyl-D-glutamate--2,6-diaminopimelate ligase [Planctomycetota bacterium]
MRLKDLAMGCFEVPAELADLEVTGIENDSRVVQPGVLFVAVRGTRTDGSLHAAEAGKAGAVCIVGEARPGELRAARGTCGPCAAPYIAVPDSREALGRLAARFHGVDQGGIDIAGVTGTKGKTTTTWILDAIFRAAGKVSALFGTIENRLAGAVHAADNTTPSCLYLHRSLGALRRAGGTHAVLEVSSHGILQRRIAGLQFRCGIFTNVAPEHLDYHTTFESYVETKTSFFLGLAPSAHAVLPREEPASLLIAARTRANVAWYGAESQDGVERLRGEPEGIAFCWKGRPVRSQLWGHFNLLNTLAAMTAAECMGFTRDEIILGVESAVAPPGRLEEVTRGLPFRVFVDYAHTDGSLEKVLQVLRAITPGRLITVFGCGGDRDTTKRSRMGRVAEDWSDQVVVTSDNPRGEDPRKILSDIMKGFKRPEDAVFEVDRKEAIALGIRMARPSDTVLIAGKGHETYQELEGRRLHFDDREVARELIAESHPL